VSAAAAIASAGLYLLPYINFAVLLLIVIGLQFIRWDLKQRLKRFERIEKELEDLRQAIVNARNTEQADE
jgi:hypothetical protein